MRVRHVSSCAVYSGGRRCREALPGTVQFLIQIRGRRALKRLSFRKALSARGGEHLRRSQQPGSAESADDPRFATTSIFTVATRRQSARVTLKPPSLSQSNLQPCKRERARTRWIERRTRTKQPAHFSPRFASSLRWRGDQADAAPEGAAASDGDRGHHRAVACRSRQKRNKSAVFIRSTRSRGPADRPCCTALLLLPHLLLHLPSRQNS